jgi:hypothetical protein
MFDLIAQNLELWGSGVAFAAHNKGLGMMMPES